MGGQGSGSYYRMRSGKDTAESSLPLDIRELKRQGLLVPGGSITSRWSSGGNVHSSIGATVYRDHLLLRYTHRKTEHIEQAIYFTYTPCHFGGERIWFRCPYCDRRCAVIYSAGKYYACRICGNLTYETCNETPRERRFTKADKLREKIGAPAGAFNSLPVFKPKFMHYSTWMRIRNQIQRLEGIGFTEMAIRLGV